MYDCVLFTFQVYNIHGLNEHKLEEYFEQTQNGGGKVFRTRVIEENSHAIVKFENSSSELHVW